MKRCRLRVVQRERVREKGFFDFWVGAEMIFFFGLMAESECLLLVSVIMELKVLV